MREKAARREGESEREKRVEGKTRRVKENNTIMIKKNTDSWHPQPESPSSKQLEDLSNASDRQKERRRRRRRKQTDVRVFAFIDDLLLFMIKDNDEDEQFSFVEISSCHSTRVKGSASTKLFRSNENLSRNNNETTRVGLIELSVFLSTRNERQPANIRSR